MTRHTLAKRICYSMLGGLLIGVLVSEITFAFLKQNARPPRTIELVIPAGTSELVSQGVQPPSIPTDMKFVVGDKLQIKNEDSTDHQLGPLWIPSGTTAEMVFAQAENTVFQCSFQPANYLGFDVEEPLTLWTRISGILFAGIPMGALLAVYSAVMPEKKENDFQKNVQP